MASTYLNSVSASGSFVAHASCCGRSPKRRPGALGGNRKQHTGPSQTPRLATGGGQHWSGGTACLEALHSRKSETEHERTCGSEIAEETSFDIGGLADCHSIGVRRSEHLGPAWRDLGRRVVFGLVSVSVTAKRRRKELHGPSLRAPLTPFRGVKRADCDDKRRSVGDCDCARRALSCCAAAGHVCAAAPDSGPYALVVAEAKSKREDEIWMSFGWTWLVSRERTWASPGRLRSPGTPGACHPYIVGGSRLD